MLRKKIEGETQNLAEMISFIMYLQHLARSLAQITGSIKVYCIHELNRFFFLVNYQSTLSLLHKGQKGHTSISHSWGKEEEEEG